MADTTISQLTQSRPTPGHLLPYSTGANTLATPVSALFQDTGDYTPVGIGTTEPIRHLHIASTTVSVEQIWEQKNGMPNFRKWNLVINNGENAPNVKSSIFLRQLNDTGTGGPVVWSYEAALSAHSVSGPKQLIELRDFGTSQTAFTTIQTTRTIVCMGYTSIGANTFKDISNLPYTSINSYVAFVQNNGLEPGYGTTGWALGQPEKISSSTLRLWNQGDYGYNTNWMAIGY